jgi:uncharacterized protein YndB with AHSA1/START domain
MPVTTRPGQVLRDEDGVRLELQRDFDQGVQEVWSALTAPERTGRWIGTWTGDPADGTVQLLMLEEPDGAASPVTVVVCEPPTRLVLDLPSPDGTWRVQVQLSAIGPGTRLRFVQRLAEPYDARSIGPGWHWYLDRLAAEVTGRDPAGPWEDYAALAEAYATPD